MKYKMIPVEKFWKECQKGRHQISKTLVLVEGDIHELYTDFAYVMKGFFDHHRQGVSFKKDSIKFVLVHDEPEPEIEVGLEFKLGENLVKISAIYWSKGFANLVYVCHPTKSAGQLTIETIKEIINE